MMDEREFFLAGLGVIALIGSVSAMLVGLFGAIFICLSAFLVYQASTYLSRSPLHVGNLLKSYRGPRTVWFSRLQHGEVWVPPNVDEAIERLYERIITEYVISWYEELSEDTEFLQEVRVMLRDASTNIILRLSKVDITDLLMGEVVPHLVQHIDGYLWANLQARQEERRKDFRFHYTSVLGKDVHISLSSREAELEYLEDLSDRIIPLIIRRESYKSRLVSSIFLSLLSRTVLLNLLDSLCNARTVNKLLSLWFSPDPVKEFVSSTDPPVKFLFRFVHSHHHNVPSSLHLDLSQILANQELLCQFVHYLKKCGGVNLLNFCLAIEDFNKKIIVVGLDKSQLISLHSEARLLFNTYMREGSSQFIAFQQEIVEEIDQILQGDFKDVEKLRTTPPLFRAYEQAFNNLEDNYCPRFHISSQYLTEHFGQRPSEIRPPAINKSSSIDRSSRSRLCQLRQGVLAHTVEGSSDLAPESAYDLVSTIKSESLVDPDLESRDLNAWRVEIPRLEARSSGSKSCFVFIIQVQRIDVASVLDGQDLQWVVARQYHEFYTLQTALVEYHGLFEDAKLPARGKLFQGRGLDVLQSKILPFQDYLVKLLQKPSLKKSDLLFTFLTSQSEFTEAASQSDLTRIIKNVPKRLTKEKGQFLHGFINSFVNTSLPPAKGKFNFCKEDSSNDADTSNSIYQDNFSHLFPFSSSTLDPGQTFKPDGLYDIVLYVCTRLLNINQTFLRLLYSVKWLTEASVNHMVNYLLANKLAKLLNNARVAFIIDVIQESIFTREETVPEEANSYLQAQTLKLFRGYLPGFLRRLSPEGFDKGTQEILETLQDPCVNKQLVYSLLEQVLPKIFPELRREKIVLH